MIAPSGSDQGDCGRLPPLRGSILSAEAARFVRPTDYLLVKLASRCNLNCTYCYWFRDATVYEQDKLLREDVEAALLTKLAWHITHYQLSSFFILFHGGEPLLFGKERFDRLCAELREMEAALGIRLKLSLTTNGMLVDPQWVELFRNHGVSITVSIDGPPEVHDARRIDFRDKGSLDRVLLGLDTLRSGGIEPGVLAVCTPRADPRRICDYFILELGVTEFDILVPDATHEDDPDSIAPFYIGLFDAWLDHWSAHGVRVRILESFVKGLAGYEANSECLGYGPNLHFSLLPDGSLEALDTLRMIGDGSTRSRFNILTHEIQDLQNDPFWQEALEASIHLARPCSACQYRFACGGAHLGWRWSKSRRFDNPSVYCKDLKQIFGHVWSRMVPDLQIASPKLPAIEPLVGETATQ